MWLLLTYIYIYISVCVCLCVIYIYIPVWSSMCACVYVCEHRVNEDLPRHRRCRSWWWGPCCCRASLSCGPAAQASAHCWEWWWYDDTHHTCPAASSWPCRRLNPPESARFPLDCWSIPASFAIKSPPKVLAFIIWQPFHNLEKFHQKILCRQVA